MQCLSCPWCNNALPDAISTEVCTTCGKTLHSSPPITPPISLLSETSEQDSDAILHSSSLGTQSHSHKILLPFSHFLLRKGFLSWPRLWHNHHLQGPEAGQFPARLAVSALTFDPLDEEPFSGPLQDPASENNDISELRPDGQMTWQKVVEPSPHRPSRIYPPRPPLPEDERLGGGIAPPRIFASSTSKLQALKRSAVSRVKRTSPWVMFWISTAILIICMSVFGLGSAFGQRQTSPTKINNQVSLQITPSQLSIGATMTLSGDYFSANALIGLARDHGFPLKDTSGSPSTQADKTGHFTDTIIVDDWGSGTHVITAEDSITRKVASFPVVLDGDGMTLSPPYLDLSVNTLDFGLGDQATNSAEKLTLSDTGNSDITWQAIPSEPWLLMTPTQGVVTHDISQEVTVAVDRSQLPPNSYTAQINFSSNGGDDALNVLVQVSKLEPQHDAIMQISPGVLSFSAADGSSNVTPQQITVSNSGGQTMNWQVSADAPWLTVSPRSMTVAPAGKVTAQVSVASSQLLPGIYSATLTFTAQNTIGNSTVFHSPQQVAVTVTITPPCTLVVGPAMLDFSAAYRQPAPSPKTINVTATPGCTAPLTWDAKSNVGWLRLSGVHGSTPGSVNVGINGPGLTPGSYSGLITFNSSAGTQTVVVTFLLGQALPLLEATPASININVSGGTSSPVDITNTGGGALNWSATLGGGAPAFVSLSTRSGANLASGDTASFNIVINANGVASGSYQTSVQITAKNAANGQSVTGSPATIPIHITIVSPPLMQVSTTHLTFSGLTGSTVNSQSLTIKNSGGGTLSWTVSSPSQSWLSVSQTAGSTGAGTSSTLVFSIQTNGLAAKTYTDQVVVTPSVGNPVTVKISLTLTDPPPTPTPPPKPTPTPTPKPTPTPTPTPTPKSTPIPPPKPKPTPLPTPIPPPKSKSKPTITVSAIVI